MAHIKLTPSMLPMLLISRYHERHGKNVTFRSNMISVNTLVVRLEYWGVWAAKSGERSIGYPSKSAFYNFQNNLAEDSAPYIDDLPEWIVELEQAIAKLPDRENKLIKKRYLIGLPDAIIKIEMRIDQRELDYVSNRGLVLLANMIKE